MSRRKQPKPRHIESEDEIASLLQNDTESRSPSNSSNPADDAHVCGKCREEFLGLAEFLAHKKTCSRKRLVLVCNPNESESNLMSEGNLDINYNPKVPKLIDQFDYTCIGSDADEDVDEDDMDNFDDDENEIMDAEDREIANEEIDEDLIKISMMNAAANNMSDGEEEENDDDNDGDDNNNEKRQNNFDGISEKFGDGSKLDKDNPHHSAIFPFSQSLPSSNVTLEPMMATRAAVAQFAENNALPSDVNMLQTTLYSLQQQQLVQLQLIHQLQQQIIMGIPPPMIANGTLPLMPPLSSLPSCKPVSRSQENSLEKSTKEKKEVDLSKTEPTPGSNIKSEFESMVMASTSSISPLTGNTAIPSALPLPSNNMMSQSAQPSEFAKLTKLVERSQYVSEDPFFRHKCRLCHKVFGSDSALQIHIRSHTGERPFKCNICGNRFTTRGNLKVHFERHKAKYPHVKMNPHPVPEHLDKLPPMPMMGSPFPSTAPTHLPLPSGIMNSTPPMSIAPMMSSMYSRIGFPPKPDIRASPPEDQRIQSPVSSANSSMTSPAPAISEAPASKSPNVGDAGSPPITSETSSTALASTAESSPSQKFTSPLMSSLPQVTPASSYPLLSPLPSAPPPLTPAVPTGSSSRDSILPSKMIDQDENLEKYMEIDRSSETSKLQQLVDNLENKVSDPNQCVICHRVLSCKSALQMHYRIHTGERPYKCKICRRAFTTKGNLKTHMGVHRMKPPIRMMHQCPVCHKSFTNLLVLQQHIRSHATPPGIPPLPDMTHFNAMHSFPPQMDWPQRPYDLSFRRYPDKELDLSRSSSMFHFRKPENESNDGDGIEEQYGDDEESMDIDEEMNALKEESEANYKNEENPSGDSGAGSEEGHHSSIDEEEKKETEVERPHSAASEVSRDSGRSASPNSENDHSPATDAAQIYPSLANSGSVSTYNTSLAALEERVRAIDSSMLQSPMNRFNPFMLHGFQPPISNGDHNPLMKSPNMPYGSESGSEGNITGDDESKPGTPALSINSDGGSSIMSGLRDGDKSTTCNICLKAFACRSALDIHYRSHTKERPYKCGACDRSFSTKGNMKQHMLTHKIRDLPNSFNNNSNSSASHENNNSNDSVSEEKKEEGHSRPESTPAANGNNDSGSSRASNGISPNTSNGGDVSPFLRRTPLKHQCQVCQKGFSSASALQIHIRTHTGDKPFKCNVCGKAFTTKGNLKVHMGTHMWNNSPSRRGRRMSIEPPFMLAHKENPYMSGFPHRSTPDFFPFQFPPFMNGVPPHKMNEISVIQSLGGGMGHLPPMSLSSEHLLSPRSKGVDSSESKPDSWRKSDSNGNVTSTGELDLSMKSNPATSPNNNNKRSPTSDTWNSAWKTMCHLCNQNFPSPTALDNHMQNFHLKGGESHSKSLVA